MEYKNATGRIYDIQGYAVHDGPGIRTTVFTKGCPLSCLWCHSPESQGFGFELGWLPLKCLGMDLCVEACKKACPRGAISRGEPTKRMGTEELVEKAELDRTKCDGCLKCTEVCFTKALYSAGWDTTVDEVYDRLMKDVPFFENGGGVTVSGGEAMSQFEFTLNLLKRLKDSGIHICLDTTGFAPGEKFLEILPYVDLFLYDIKHMDSKRHKALTGVPNELILDNARLLAKNGAKIQVRYPVIPKLNDSRIRYVESRDREAWRALDGHLPRIEFDRKVRDRLGLVLLEGERIIGILRWNLFWDEVPFCNLLYIAEDRRG